MKKFSLHISTCPNDTFMFDALLHGKIDTLGYSFNLTMEDIDLLNKSLKDSIPDISKMSYAQYPTIKEHYKILNSGSALGSGNGPLLVSKHKIYPDEISSLTIAIPGENTSANRLLSAVSDQIKERKVYLFSDISEAVLSGEVDAGVLIHEERFSYRRKGLRLVLDLGDYWEKKSGMLVPLGAIVVRRTIEPKIQQEIDHLIRSSVEFAFQHPSSSYDFVKQNARELSDEVIEKHIEMFVNAYSLDLSEHGKESVLHFLQTDGIELQAEDIFV